MSSASILALIEPRGYLESLISIATAIGIWSNPLEVQASKILSKIKNIKTSVSQLRDELYGKINDLQKQLTTNATINIRSSIPAPNDIPSGKVEKLIKQLLLLKYCSSDIIFSIILRYPRADGTATQGFAAQSDDKIEDIIAKIDKFMFTISTIKEKNITAYVCVRLRGRYDNKIENFASAVTTTIATEICQLPQSISLMSAENQLESDGAKTKVFLRPKETRLKAIADFEVDVRKRVFLIGDSRTGKSTLGNAIHRYEGKEESSGSLTSIHGAHDGGPPFKESRGMTGTLSIDNVRYVAELTDKMGTTLETMTVEIYDTPGLNDKDGLDVLYESLIEDKIFLTEKVSTFIMTIGVDGGLNGSSIKSIENYVKLFGNNIYSMLIIVLTTIETVSGDRLKNIRDDCLSDVLSINRNIKEEHIFAVSLPDLRNQQFESKSYEVIGEIKNLLTGMRLQLTQILREQLQLLRQSVGVEDEKARKALRLYMNTGWQKFEYLATNFRNSGFSKMVWIPKHEGFVYQVQSLLKSIISGKISSIKWREILGKTIIQVDTWDERSALAWEKFKEENKGNKRSRELMQELGDFLYDEDLSVVVMKKEIEGLKKHHSSLYKLSICDANFIKHRKLKETVDELLDGKTTSLRKELVDQLVLINVINPSTKRDESSIARKSPEEWKKFYLRMNRRVAESEKVKDEDIQLIFDEDTSDIDAAQARDEDPYDTSFNNDRTTTPIQARSTHHL